MSAKRAVLFDVGGVLILPSGKSIARWLKGHLDLEVDPDLARDAFFRAGYDALKTEYPPSFWQGDEMAFAWARHAGVPEDLALEAWSYINTTDSLADPLWDETADGARETLEEISKLDYSLAVVSNADGRLMEELARHGLARFFDVFLDSSVVGISKPDPRITRLALEQLGVEPENAWFVGEDYFFDVTGARAAGLSRVLLFDRVNLFPESHEYTRLTSLRELPQLLRRENP